MVLSNGIGISQFGSLHINSNLDKARSPERIDIIANIFGNGI